MVVDNFRSFFQRNLVQYQRRDLPVHAVGSIAFNYQEELKEAAEKEGFTIGHLLATPMEGLIEYHQ